MKKDNWKKILLRKENEILSISRLFIYLFFIVLELCLKGYHSSLKTSTRKKRCTFIQNDYHVASHDATRRLQIIKGSDWLSVFLPSNHILPYLTFSFLFNHK